MEQIIDLDGESSGGNEDAIVFARSGKMQRSPVIPQTVAASTSRCSTPSELPGNQRDAGFLSQVLTPKSGSSTAQDDRQHDKSELSELKRKVNELYEFVKTKNNVHLRIKQLVTSIKSAVTAAERGQKELRSRAEKAEKALTSVNATAVEQETPRSNPTTRTEKRTRDTPGEEEDPKKQRSGNECVSEQNGSGWRTVKGQKEKNTARKERKRQKKEPKKKEKQRSPRERFRGDALVIEASDKTSYAAILRRVREDPELKELGENVVRTRRTQKGDMLFELKKDPSIKSSACRELVAKSLGNEASVRALSQEAVIECRELDEITTEDDVRGALLSQCNLEEAPQSIRLRRAYGGMQIATIRLPVAAAKKLVEAGKIKVGWSVCPLKLIPRETNPVERCFKCMDFGHRAINCKGPDRSEHCRKCGEKGHVGRDCLKSPRCMLCKVEEGNAHTTGGFKCPKYQKAKAGQ